MTYPRCRATSATSSRASRSTAALTDSTFTGASPAKRRAIYRPTDRSRWGTAWGHHASECFDSSARTELLHSRTILLLSVRPELVEGLRKSRRDASRAQHDRRSFVILNELKDLSEQRT